MARAYYRLFFLGIFLGIFAADGFFGVTVFEEPDL
tara:strand:+ start:805 stop:909 length:105 start_codon:yes stop_codon:yes gene_type:complete